MGLEIVPFFLLACRFIIFVFGNNNSDDVYEEVYYVEWLLPRG